MNSSMLSGFGPVGTNGPTLPESEAMKVLREEVSRIDDHLATIEEYQRAGEKLRMRRASCMAAIAFLTPSAESSSLKA